MQNNDIENEGYKKQFIKNRINKNDDTEGKERVFFICLLIIMVFSIWLNTIAPLLTVALFITYDQLYFKNR